MMRGFVRERPTDGMKWVARAAKWWCTDTLYVRESDQMMERLMRDSCRRNNAARICTRETNWWYEMHGSCSQMMVHWYEVLYVRESDQLMETRETNAWLVQTEQCCEDLYARDQLMVWNAWLVQPSDGAMIWGFVCERDQLMERPKRNSQTDDGAMIRRFVHEMQRCRTFECVWLVQPNDGAMIRRFVRQIGWFRRCRALKSAGFIRKRVMYIRLRGVAGERVLVRQTPGKMRRRRAKQVEAGGRTIVVLIQPWVCLKTNQRSGN